MRQVIVWAFLGSMFGGVLAAWAVLHESGPSSSCDGGICALGPLFASIAGLLGAGAGAIVFGSAAAIVAGATSTSQDRTIPAGSVVFGSSRAIVIGATPKTPNDTGLGQQDKMTVPNFRPHSWWLLLTVSAARYFSRALSVVTALFVLFDLHNVAARTGLIAALLAHAPFRDKRSALLTRVGVTLVTALGLARSVASEGTLQFFRAMWVAALFIALFAAWRATEASKQP